MFAQLFLIWLLVGALCFAMTLSRSPGGRKEVTTTDYMIAIAKGPIGVYELITGEEVAVVKIKVEDEK